MGRVERVCRVLLDLLAREAWRRCPRPTVRWGALSGVRARSLCPEFLFDSGFFSQTDLSFKPKLPRSTATVSADASEIERVVVYRALPLTHGVTESIRPNSQISA